MSEQDNVRVVQELFAAFGRGDLKGLLGTLGLEVPALTARRNGGWDPAAVQQALLDGLPKAEVERVVQALEAEVRIDETTIRELQSLTWRMLAELQASGITVGAHTKTHALLTNEDDDTVREETAGSRHALEQRLGTRVDHFAYPAGRFDPRTVAAVASAGYRFAYTICRHRDRDYPLLTIPRMGLWETSCLDTMDRFAPAIMSCQLNSVFELLPSCRADHGRARQTAGAAQIEALHRDFAGVASAADRAAFGRLLSALK